MALLALTITSHDYDGSREGSPNVTITATGNVGVYPTNGAVIAIANINAALATAGVDRDISTIHFAHAQPEAQTNRYTWVKSSTVTGLFYAEVTATDTEVANAVDLTTDLINFTFVCGK